MSDELVRIAVVPNEIAAEAACALLRTDRIRCAHRKTDVAAAAWRGAPGAGPREIVVSQDDVVRARELLGARPPDE